MELGKLKFSCVVRISQGAEGANFVCMLYHHACLICGCFQAHVAGVEGPFVIGKQNLKT